MNKTVSDFITIVTERYDRNQPWLAPSFQNFKRKNPNSRLSQSIIRKSSSGSIRNAGLSSMTDLCEKKLAHSFFGISSYKLGADEIIHSAAYGIEFTRHIDSILAGHEDWVSGEEKVGGNNAWNAKGSVTLRSNPYPKVDGTLRKTFWGCWDYYNQATDELLELKAVKVLPSKAKEKHLRQLALYIVATGFSGGWLLYLPADLSTLSLNDPSSFRAFYLSLEEAYEISKDIKAKVEKTIWKMSWKGNDEMPYLSPAWFYYIVRSAEGCDDEYCCGRASQWHQENAVNPDWSITPRQ